MRNETAGQIIRTFRENECLTQEELADIIHVTKGKLAHWEDDVTIPRPAMVARLTGALRLSAKDTSILEAAVSKAREKQAQKDAELQKVKAKQDEETERLMYRAKALNMLPMGIVGFVLGLLFVFITGAYRDTPWYFPFVIGLYLSVMPFGWKILSNKNEKDYRVYYYYYRSTLVDFLVKMFCFALKLTGAFFVGFVAYPIGLLYYAYKAGRKGSLYRMIMFAVFAIITAFIGTIVLGIVLSCFL